MDNVAVCSMCNDSVRRGDLARYMRQMREMAWPDVNLRVYVVEGDSVDDTYARLQAWAAEDHRVRLAKFDLGAPIMGSIEDKGRFLRGNTVGSYCRQQAIDDGWADWILWVESDLIWPPTLVQRMVESAKRLDAGLLVPWVHIRRPEAVCEAFYPVSGAGTWETDWRSLEALPEAMRAFYDTWAYRYAEDRRFTNYEKRPAVPMQLWSAGSCLLGRADVVAASNRVNDRAIVGWCRQAIDAGHTLWLDPAIHVWHKAVRG